MKKILLLFVTIISINAFAQADIVVTNTDNQSYYVPGTTVVYSVIVANIGNAPAANVTVNNPIPSGISSFVWTGPFDASPAVNDYAGAINSAVNFSVASLAVGQVLTFTITINIPNYFAGSLISKATITTTTAETNIANNSVTDIDTEGQGADIVVINTNGQNFYSAGTSTVYNLKVKNAGPNNATNIAVSNPIPAGITSFSWTGSNGSIGTNVGLTNNIPTLAVGSEINYTITAIIPATFTGNLVSAASASSANDPDASCVACVDTDLPTPKADLVVVNTDNETVYVPGSLSVYTVNVTNNGPDLATNVLVQNPIPAGIAQFSWTGNGANGNNLALNNVIPFLNVGQTVVYTISVLVPPTYTGNLITSATATATTLDPNPGCAQCSDTNTLGNGADLVLSNTDNIANYTTGTNNTYILNLTNFGPATATNVVVTNPIPAGIIAFSWIGSNGSSGTNVGLLDTIANLPLGTTITYTITLGVPAAFTGNLTCIASVTSTTSDPRPICVDCADTDLPKGLEVKNTDSSTIYVAGLPRVYLVTVTNNGTLAETNITIKNLVPVGIPPANFSWTGNSTSGTGSINNVITTLNPGQTITYTVTILVPSTYSQTANLNNLVTYSTISNPNPVCTQCLDTDKPTPFADLVINKTDNSSTFLLNSDVTYTISVLNAGPSDAANVQVTDIIPIGISAMSWTSNNGTFGSGSLTQNIPTLAAGQLIVYKVTIKVPAVYSPGDPSNPGTFLVNLTNKVVVTSSTPDQNPAATGTVDTDTPASKSISVDTSKYASNIQGLIKDIMIAQPCVQVSNFTSSNGIGFGYFKRNNSNFDFKEGIVIRSGNAKLTEGSYNGLASTLSSIGSGAGDSDLLAINQANGNTGSINDASFVKFDFVPTASEFSFNFLFTSQEYGQYQCGFSDAFAFILTNLSTGQVQNIAVVPGTSTPVDVRKLRNGIYNTNTAGCGSVNSNYFDKFNAGTALECPGGNCGPSNVAASHLNMRGQTKSMVAKATVNIGTPYSIKLVIGDYNDSQFDSAVFIEAGSFKLGQPDLQGTGANAGISAVNDNIQYCDGEDLLIQASPSSNPSITYSWEKDKVLIPGANSYTLLVTDSGAYTVNFDYGGGCKLSQKVFIKPRLNLDLIPVATFQRIQKCPTETSFNLKKRETAILNGNNPANFILAYYLSEADANGEINEITNPSTFAGTNGQIIYMRLEYSVDVTCKPIYKINLVEQKAIFSYPDDGGDPNKLCNASISASPMLTAPFTPSGTFSFAPTSALQTGFSVNATTGVIGFTSATPGPYVIYYTLPALDCSPYVSSTTVVISNCLVANIAPLPAKCSGNAIILSNTNNLQPNVVYNWFQNGINIGTTTTPNLPTSIPTNNSNVPISVSYTVIVSNNTPADTQTDTKTLTINPTPTAQFSNAALFKVCTNTATTLSIVGLPNSLVTFNNGTTSATVTLDASGTYTITTPIISATTTYKLTNVASGFTPDCAKAIGASDTGAQVVITTGEPTATVATSTLSTCSNVATNVLVQGTPSSTITFTVNGGAAQTASIGTSGSVVIPTGAIANTSTTAVNYAYVITNITTTSTPPCSATITGQQTVVSVNPLPTANIALSAVSVCSGTPATFQFSGTSGDIVTYSNGVTQATVTIGAANVATVTTANLTGTTTYSLVKVDRPSTTCSQPLSVSVTVTIDPLTAIGTQPAGTTKCIGESVTFSVVATGTNLTYQWQKNNVNIASATATTFSIASVAATDAGVYKCIVSGKCNTVTSATATLVVTPATIIVTNAITTTPTVCVGQPISISITATGQGLTYQWKNNGANVTTAGASATSTTLNILTAVATDAGIYTCEILDSCNKTTTSSVVTIVVNELPKIVSQAVLPITGIVCEAQPFLLSVTATGSNLTYQWFKGTTAIAGATTASYTIANALLTSAGNYYCTVSGSCAPSVTSVSQTITVNAAPNFTSQPAANTTICEGQSISLSVVATGNNLTYQWLRNGVNVSSANAGTSTTTPNLVINPATAADAGGYTCLITGTGGLCTSATSATATVVVNKLPIIMAQNVLPTTGIVCEAQPFTLSVTSIGSNLTYQWFKGTTPIAGATSATFTISAAIVSDSGTYKCIVSGSCTPAVTSVSQTIVVNPAPQFTTQPTATTTICANQNFALSVTATGNNLTYQWQKDGVNIATANAASSATTPNLVISPAQTSDSGNYTCIITSTNSSCAPKTSAVASVTVSASVVITPIAATQTICETDAINIILTTTGGTNPTFQWRKNGVEIPAATTSIYSKPNATVGESGNYDCVIQSGSCPSTTTNVCVVKVNPTPNAQLTFGSTSSVCMTDPSSFRIDGTPTAIVTYTINGGAPKTATIDSTGKVILPTGSLTVNVTYTLIKVESAAAPICSRTLNDSKTIVVNKKPVVKLADGYVCLNTTTGLTERNYVFETGFDPADYSFVWYKNNVIEMGQTAANYTATTIGIYKVKVTNILTGCSSSDAMDVTGSKPPTATDVQVTTDYFSSNATIVITATPAGDYEYQLDFGPFQDSNTFEGIANGEHVVKVRDRKACGEIPKTFTIIDYPKFFTPNGDGFNDTWKISTLNNQPTAKIYIFDRSGKLLKQIGTTGEGWDGTFVGNPLPADDYWFTIQYTENAIDKEFKAHFSLKR